MSQIYSVLVNIRQNSDPSNMCMSALYYSKIPGCDTLNLYILLLDYSNSIIHRLEIINN